ncbi:MAG: metallophosphoesterase family protein [Nitrososphaerales archaeon]
MLEEIIEKSMSVTYTEFSMLIKNMSLIQQQERSEGVTCDSTVKGGLVRVKQGRKLILVGDLHGDLQSLALILEKSGFLEDLSNIMIFLGDYGDRGRESVEVYYVVLYLKARYPNRVILMRGNHEGPESMPFYPHDLPDAFLIKFGKAGELIYTKLRSLFDLMYHGVVLENSYLILHGGVPTNFHTIDDIATANKTNAETRYLEEILWNDPREIEGSQPSARGYGKYFGKDLTERALKIVNVKALIRAHEVCDGFKVNHKGLVLTLFSCKAPYGNKSAAYLAINQNNYNLNAEELSRIVELI